MDQISCAMFAHIGASLDSLRRAKLALAEGRARERLRAMKDRP